MAADAAPLIHWNTLAQDLARRANVEGRYIEGVEFGQLSSARQEFTCKSHQKLMIKIHPT